MNKSITTNNIKGGSIMTTLNKSNINTIKGGNVMENHTLAELEAELKAAKAINDFEAVAVICNDIADLKGEPRPYDQEWFDDL